MIFHECDKGKLYCPICGSKKWFILIASGFFCFIFMIAGIALGTDGKGLLKLLGMGLFLISTSGLFGVEQKQEKQGQRPLIYLLLSI